MDGVELRAILRDAFGDSSSDGDGESSDDLREPVGVDAIVQRRQYSIFGDSRVWEPIPEINGLWICRDFLSTDQQSALLSALEKEGYLAEDSPNQV